MSATFSLDPKVRRHVIVLFAVALLVRLLVAWPMQRPGYMDAAYYVDSALALHEGRGFNLPLIWNYLPQGATGLPAQDLPPADLPAPSHLYWMPLTSILISASFAVLGPSYRAAQVPSILLSALLPLLAYVVAYQASRSLAPDRPARARRHGLYAGLLATLSGFYTAYWVSPDSFAPFALFGALCLWAWGRAGQPEPNRAAPAWVLAGACAGLAHLTRADGLLLLVAGLLIGLVDGGRHLAAGRPRQAWRLAGGLSIAVACYLAVMAPWFLRNLRAIGRPLSTAGLRTLWLTDYDDLYSYGKALSLRAYLDWGWGNILRSKLRALWLNAQTLLVVGWMIALAPLGLIGAWKLRRHAAFRPAWLYAALLYLAMSLAFTFPGWRGGMLHSTVALLPAFYTAAFEGLDQFVLWMARRRTTWQPDRARQVFSVGLVLLALGLSAWLYLSNLDRYTGPHLYDQVAAWMAQNAPPDARVMVNDPASFYYHSRLSSLPIPNADLQAVLDVMDRYGASYLLLDANNVSLQTLYRAPESADDLTLVKTFSDGQTTAHLFQR
jgi:hypothetical protein